MIKIEILELELGTPQDKCTMTKPTLSVNTRKSLCNNLNETSGNELADLLQRLESRVAALERNKVDITRITPPSAKEVRIPDPQELAPVTG